MKATILLLLCAVGLYAENVAVSFYGPNTNGVATNFPVTWVRCTNEVAPPGFALMSVEGARALKAATQASYDAYASNETWKVESVVTNRLAQFQAVSVRLDYWQALLGTPQNVNSNFVNIAQASQWAREMVWLQKRILKIVAAQYRPEEDDQ